MIHGLMKGRFVHMACGACDVWGTVPKTTVVNLILETCFGMMEQGNDSVSYTLSSLVLDRCLYVVLLGFYQFLFMT